ncbi:DUF4436 family protein [Herbiconiux liangxiaofengii]|uniref:DUF4436 family protein n=1 Tax=Herbiconiux liangxiaofengii TaxID=3342795 RepID=UPI0035B88B2E
MTDARPVPRPRRRWLVPVAVLVAVAVYAVVVLLYAGSYRVSSDACHTVVEGTDGATVVLQPSAVHATNQRIEFQLTPQLSGALLSNDNFTPKNDLSVLISPVDGSQVLTFKGGDALAGSTQSVYAEGVVEEWPFDTYRAEVTAVAFTGQGDDKVTIPTTVCLHDSVPGWQLSTEMVSDTDNTVETTAGTVPLPSVAITATRTASTVAFGIVLLALMALIPALVLFVAISTYTGRRKVEATLTSWMGAMLFATIPLRNFLPGSPPVGSWIDYLIVLWVIVGLVAGLTIYVLAWNRWGTRVAPRGSAPPPDPLD